MGGECRNIGWREKERKEKKKRVVWRCVPRHSEIAVELAQPRRNHLHSTEYRITKIQASRIDARFLFVSRDLRLGVRGAGASRARASILNRPTYRVFKRSKR